MAVLLPNARIGVARKTHPFEVDAHGTPVAARGRPDVDTYRPGAVKERTGGDEAGPLWSIRVDPAEWPVEVGDHVLEDGGPRVWVVVSADLHQVPGVPDVDYVAVSAVLEEPEVP